MSAMALAGEPELLIADEPTTALDVTLQAQILALLKRLQQQMGMTLWLISHDLALVASLADRIAVMQHGNVVEMVAAKAFFAQPQHPYSQQLVNALPNWQACRDHVSRPQPALLSLDDVRVYYPIRKGVFKRLVGYVKAVDGVSWVVPQGQTVALVGESGCGKSSLSKALLGLIPTTGGRVILDGCDLSTASASVRQQSRAAMQIVFQDPFAAMNPRWLVGAVIEEGMRALRPDMTAPQRAERVVALLAQVGLPADAAQRYPHEFSGGQRQRICIARALAVEPKLIICDEPTSALDVSIQAQILALLKQLQQQQGVSYLLITHNWGVVAEMADSVAVMYQGRLVEQGAVATVLQQPQHPYTRQLLEAVPRLA
jgi:peptide/nickel transport system ATP-binding protein